MRATFWNAPARGRPRRAWRWARSRKRFCAQFGIECAEPRDRRGRGAPGARRRLGTNWSRSASKHEVLLGCVDAEAEAAHEGSGRPGLSHRRHRGRRLRSGRARRAAGPRLAHHLGFAPGRATGAGHRLHAGGEGRGDRIRRRRRGVVRIEGAGHDSLQSRSSGVSLAARIAPAAWKAA